MSNGSELKSSGAKALRAAGFKPSPRLWLTDEQLDLVFYMARQNEQIVNEIRARAKATSAARRTREQEIEAAWRARDEHPFSDNRGGGHPDGSR